jgi:hypothetical protein
MSGGDAHSFHFNKRNYPYVMRNRAQTFIKITKKHGKTPLFEMLPKG